MGANNKTQWGDKEQYQQSLAKLREAFQQFATRMAEELSEAFAEPAEEQTNESQQNT